MMHHKIIYLQQNTGHEKQFIDEALRLYGETQSNGLRTRELQTAISDVESYRKVYGY
jgi:hypothetical protein